MLLLCLLERFFFLEFLYVFEKLFLFNVICLFFLLFFVVMEVDKFVKVDFIMLVERYLM